MQAQVSYNAGDLLLNFRDISQTPPVASSLSGSDLVVDLGPVGTITSTPGTEVVASASLVTGVFGTPSAGNQIGLSAAAETGYANSTTTLFLTRGQTGTTAPTEASQARQQSSEANLEPVAQVIDNIGGGAGLPAATALSASGTPSPFFNGAAKLAAANAFSYQQQGQSSTTASGQGSITYGNNISLNANNGGATEYVQSGSGDVYEALWEVPASDTVGGSDVYEGYLTFKPSGEVDFTSAVSAVPEPSTYGAFAAAGLLALALRRQIRSVIA
jgi:hypothetical protein